MRLYKNLMLSSVLILSVYEGAIASSSQSPTDEPAGSAERNWGGSATFVRLREIEKEGVLEVNSSVRARDNFNRLDIQVKELKKEKAALEKAHLDLPEKLNDFRRCVFEKIDMESHVRKGGGNIKMKEDGSIDARAIGECAFQYNQFLAKAGKKHFLPSEPHDFGSLGERVGWYERIFGLSTTHQRVKELEKEKNLDVSSGVRVRDNFNRVRRQIFHLKKNINSDIGHLSEHAKVASCVETARDYAFIAHPAFPTIQEEFYKCFRSGALTS